MKGVALLLKRDKISVATLMLVLLIVPIMAPFTAADANTSARSSPDFSVTSFTLDGAGSVQSGTDIFVENATHVARIVASNTGSSAGSVVVSLYHQGSASATRVLVSAITIGPINPGTSHSPVLIDWTASPGNDQTLYAEVFSLQDPNSR